MAVPKTVGEKLRCGMKVLFLIRHAKSSWDNTALPDKDRPLDDRGKRDAPKMGKRLAKRDVKPDLILSSPAMRALTTASLDDTPTEEAGAAKHADRGHSNPLVHSWIESVSSSCLVTLQQRGMRLPAHVPAKDAGFRVWAIVRAALPVERRTTRSCRADRGAVSDRTSCRN
jgi:Histidine phosphatase superfamily (branch 1)